MPRVAAKKTAVKKSPRAAAPAEPMFIDSPAAVIPGPLPAEETIVAEEKPAAQRPPPEKPRRFHAPHREHTPPVEPELPDERTVDRDRKSVV